MSSLARRALRSSRSAAHPRSLSSSVASCTYPNNVLDFYYNKGNLLKQGQLLHHVQGMKKELGLKQLLLVEEKLSAVALDKLSVEQLQVLFDGFERKYNIAAICDFVKARTEPLPLESILPLLHVVRSRRTSAASDLITLFHCEGFLSKVRLNITHLNRILGEFVADEQVNDAFRVLCFADQAFGSAARLNSETFSLLVPHLAQSDSWEPIFFLLSRLRGANTPSLSAYAILLRECAEKPLIRWVHAKQFLYDIFASADLKNSKVTREAAMLGLNTLVAAGRSSDVVLFFKHWERSEAAQEIIRDESLRRIKVFAATIKSSPHTKDPALIAASREALVDTLQRLSRRSFEGSAASATSESVCNFALAALRTKSNLLHSNPALAEAAIAAVLTNLPGEGTAEMAELHQLWGQLCNSLQQRPSSSDYDPRSEVLKLLSKLALSRELDVAVAAPITLFLRTLLRVAPEEARAQSSVVMTTRLGDLLVRIFGMMRDSDGITLTLLRCEEQDVLLSDKSFNIAGTIINEAGDHKLLIGLFELRAKRIVTSLRTGSDVAAPRLRYSVDNSSRVFVPVLKAFARMNDLESMMQLVMVDMQEDLGIAPRCSLLVVLISSLLQGGRAAEATEVVKRNLANAGAVAINGPTLYHPMVGALLDVSLRVAADTRNGELALQVFSQAVVDSSRNCVGGTKSAEMRMAELACLSLGSRETVHMIPMLLTSLMQAKDSPLLLSERALATVLSVAVACDSNEVFAYGLGLSNKNKDIRIGAEALAAQLRGVCIGEYKMQREEVSAFFADFEATNGGLLLREYGIDSRSFKL